MSTIFGEELSEDLEELAREMGLEDFIEEEEAGISL